MEALIGRTGYLLDVDAYGGLLPSRVISSSYTSVTASTKANIPIIAANANRKGLIIQNVSLATLYLKFGASCTSAVFAMSLAASSSSNSPALQMINEVVYCGAITGCWSAVDGFVAITEF
jgi:hypothetical protein